MDIKNLIARHLPDLGPFETLYQHFHAHPELSTQESSTAATIASHLRSLSSSLDIKTGIGGHGLCAILRNGPGKIVLLRADIDALPIIEKTGLPYASTQTQHDNTDGLVRPVMHACGHDMHITCLLAATEFLVRAQDSWSGTLISLFQPAEERALGARAMVDDGLYDSARHAVPIPDVVLGQHVMPLLPAGHTGARPGPEGFMSAADSFLVTIYGRGGHGSMPHRTIDPVVVASSIVLKLQTIVSREVPPSEVAVVSVGAIQAGQTENVISDEATLKINVRTMTPGRRDKVLASIHRIVEAECQSGNCPKPPVFKPTSSFPLTVNDPKVTAAINESFTTFFGPEHHQPQMESVLGSEDFSILATAVDRPSCFWVFGGVVSEEEWNKMENEDRLETDIPVNHSAFFAPVVQPTLKTGVEALAVGALAFLKKTS
ncbi:MAG: hypothetical protein Q9160_007322 [Pyrenula sp. 1 TL-2023]